MEHVNHQLEISPPKQNLVQRLVQEYRWLSSDRRQTFLRDF
jgi:hypothetical protein